MQSGVSKVVAFLKQLAGVFMCIKRIYAAGLAIANDSGLLPKNFNLNYLFKISY